jgi:DNA-binding transcriptional LysR family regulator
LDSALTDLNELGIFVHLVQVGSIRGAAEALGIPRSTVSRKLLDLEEPLRLCVGSNRDSAP